MLHLASVSMQGVTDHSSHANFTVACVVHADYELDVDFGTKVLDGYALLSVLVEQVSAACCVLCGRGCLCVLCCAGSGRLLPASRRRGSAAQRSSLATVPPSTPGMQSCCVHTLREEDGLCPGCSFLDASLA